MNLIEKIPANELNLLDNYIKTYIDNFSQEELETLVPPETEEAPIEKKLFFWDLAKQSYLYKLLGNQLIISKKIVVSEAIYFKEKAFKKLCEHLRDTDLYDELINVLFSTNVTIKSPKNNVVFDDKTVKWFKELLRWDLFDPINLLNNSLGEYYRDHPIVLEYFSDEDVSSKKKIQINDKTKVLKILKILAQIGEIEEEYEEFRLDCSRITNRTSETEQEVFLSIHPLDYLTMSDNSKKWRTCMSWTSGEGCYRRGTVEMMNSPMVVIAYTASSDPYMPLDESFGGWNNKTWRSLFVVNYDIISSIKAYPYEDIDLSEEIVVWLKELAAKNLGWDYSDTCVSLDENYLVTNMEKYSDETGVNVPVQHSITFESNDMYNDFGAVRHVYVYRPEEFTKPKPRPINKDYYFELLGGANKVINYSGTTNCMWCGKPRILVDFPEGEGFLRCNNCCLKYPKQNRGKRIYLGNFN